MTLLSKRFQKVVDFIILFFLSLVCWGTISLLESPSRPEMPGGAILYFTPLVAAFLFGVLRGKKVFWIAGLSSFIASLISMIIWIRHLGPHTGGSGWSAWGSYWDWSASFNWLLFYSLPPLILAFIGGFIKDFYRKKN